MPRIADIIVTSRRVVQVVNYEPEEAVVSLRMVFDEGEELDQSDIDNALDQCHAGVYKRLGIVDESEVVGGHDSVTKDTTDTRGVGAHGAGSEVRGVSRDPVVETKGRRRGANPTSAATTNAPKPATVTEAASAPANRRRGAASNPTQAPASQENTSAAPAAASGSRRRGASAPASVNGAAGAGDSAESPTNTPAPAAVTGSSRRRGSSTAPSAGSAQSAPKIDLKPSDTSKAASELGRARGHAAVFTLLEEFACDRVDQLKPDQYGEFVERALELLKAA